MDLTILPTPALVGCYLYSVLTSHNSSLLCFAAKHFLMQVCVFLYRKALWSHSGTMSIFPSHPSFLTEQGKIFLFDCQRHSLTQCSMPGISDLPWALGYGACGQWESRDRDLAAAWVWGHDKGSGAADRAPSSTVQIQPRAPAIGHIPLTSSSPVDQVESLLWADFLTPLLYASYSLLS